MVGETVLPPRPAPVRVVAASTITMTLAVIPASLIGATAVQMRADLDFDERWLGIVVGLFFAATSLSSIPGGRLAERIGPRRGLLLGIALGSASLVGIAALTRSLPHLVAFALVGGAATGTALPAASLSLVRGAPLRPGLMFGLNQSAPPAASLLAGMAVPAVSLQIGWRWAFVFAAGLALVALALLPGDEAYAHPAPRPDASPQDRPSVRPGLRAVGVGVGLGSGTAIAMGAFLVSSSVSHGIAPGTAGLLLALGSAVGIGARLVVGLAADRWAGGHLRGVAIMIGVGAAGYLGLAVGAPLLVAAAGTVVGYGFGYGWSGLLFFSISRLNPQAPALAVGVVNSGATAGAALGPPAFGALVTATSYAVTWTVAAVVSVAAAMVLVWAAARLE
jgi:predicted MFS family arabinose efflux permease